MISFKHAAYAAHMFLTHMFPWTSPSNDAIIKKQLKLVSTDVGYIAQVLSLGYT